MIGAVNQPYVGDQTQLTTVAKRLVEAVIELDGEVAGVNLIADPFFDNFDPYYNFGRSKARWLNGRLLTQVTGDAANPYTTTLRHDVATGIAGLRLWLHEVGVAEGDEVVVSIMHKAPVGETYIIRCGYYDAANVLIGSTTASATQTGDALPHTLTLSPGAMPAGAVYLQIYNQKITAATVDWCAIWAARGSSNAELPAPGGNAAAFPAGHAVGIVNLSHTAFFNNCQPGVDWAGRSRWLAYSAATAQRVNADASNPYGTPTLRHLYGGSSVFGVKIWLDEIGVGVGDILKVSATMNSAANTFGFYARYYTAADVGLGAGSTSAGTLTGTGVAQRVELTVQAVPEGAAYLLIYSQRLSGTSDIDWYALWMTRGSYIAAFPTQTTNQDRLRARLHDASGWDYDLTTVTVGSSGADYTTIAAALAAISPTPANRYRLKLAAETFTEQDLTLKDWIVLEGDSRGGSVVDGTRGSVDLGHDTIYATFNCILRNVTVRAHNVKYCVHLDAGIKAWTVLLDNCHFYHDTGFPVGIGLHANQFVVARNCIFEFGGASSSYPHGVYCHNWNEQSAPGGLTLEGCRFENCGIVRLDETGSEQPDQIKIINCFTNCVDRGVQLGTITTYYDGGTHPANELPYSLALLVQGGNCPYLEYTVADRPLLDWHVPGWEAKVKNANAGTLVQGTAVAYKYSSIGVRMDVDLAAATRCDGVLLADVTAAADGYMVTPGHAAKILCDTGAVAVGAWLKPNASTGQWEAATEATALAVALATKSAGSTGLVKARLL